MPVFWNPLTVEFSISTVWAPGRLDVVAGGEDRMVALDAGDVRAGQFVGTGDRDAVDMGVGIEDVDAQEVMVRARDII